MSLGGERSNFFLSDLPSVRLAGDDERKREKWAAGGDGERDSFVIEEAKKKSPKRKKKKKLDKIPSSSDIQRDRQEEECERTHLMSFSGGGREFQREGGKEERKEERKEGNVRRLARLVNVCSVKKMHPVECKHGERR